MLLERQDLIWVDVSIEKRVATLRTNIFIGENAGNRVFKIGTLCLIGIAHLTEFMKDVRFHHRFECRPFFNNFDLAPRIREELDSCNLDPLVHSIVMNLFHAVKLVASRTLMHIPVAGNLIVAKNGFVGANTLANQELQKSYGIYDQARVDKKSKEENKENAAKRVQGNLVDTTKAAEMKIFGDEINSVTDNMSSAQDHVSNTLSQNRN